MPDIRWRYFVLIGLGFLLAVKLLAITGTLQLFVKAEQRPTGIEWAAPDRSGPFVMRRSLVNLLQEGVWSHIIAIRMSGGLPVKYVVPDSPAHRAGLQPGDLIVRVNDTPLENQPGAYFRARLSSAPTTPIHVTWIRDGNKHTGVIILDQARQVRSAISVNHAEWELPISAMTYLQRGPFLLYTALLLGFGLWLGLLRPGHNIAFKSAILFLSIGLYLTPADTPMIAAWPDWMLGGVIFISAVAYPLHFAMLLQILALFPRPSKLGDILLRRQVILVSTVAAWITCELVTVLSLTFGWTHPVTTSIQSLYNAVHPSALSWFTTLVALTLIFAQWRQPSPAALPRLHMIVAGFSANFLVASYWAEFQPGSLAASYGLLHLNAPVLPVLVWLLDRGGWLLLKIALPAAFTYSIVSHHIFGVYSTLRNVLQYLLSSRLAVIAGGLVVFWIAADLVETLIPYSAVTPSLSMTTAVVATLTLISGWSVISQPAARYLDRKLFHCYHTARQTLIALRHNIPAFLQYSDILNQVGGAIRTSLDLSFVAFLLPSHDRNSLSVSSIEYAERQSDHHGPESFQLSPEMILNVQSMITASNGAQSWFEIPESPVQHEYQRQRFLYLLPMSNQQGLIGVLILGEKITREPFTREERNLLTSLVVPLGLALENARLVQEVSASRARLERLSHELVNVLEDERSRISRELHDDIGQALMALGIGLNMLKTPAAENPQERQQYIRDLVEYTTQTADRVRHLAKNLRPPALDSAGLNSAIESLCAEIAQRTQIVIRYKGSEVPGLSPQAETALYRFAQEALSNTVKHAAAKSIWVKLDSDASKVFLSVKDNGRGFNPSAVPAQQGHVSGLGLIGMRERLEMVGGSVTIDSTPGRGTCLTASIPVKESQHERNHRRRPRNGSKRVDLSPAG